VQLDLGCGRRPVPGAVGVDAVAVPGVRVVARLGAGALPFRTGVASAVYALNVLEHLDDLATTMAEVWRVLAPGGTCRVEVPYFAGVSAYADPTHRRWFTYTTFEHFTLPPERGWQANRHTWFGAALHDPATEAALWATAPSARRRVAGQPLARRLRERVALLVPRPRT
jgi:SAM-dependent methyltransferase